MTAHWTIARPQDRAPEARLEGTTLEFHPAHPAASCLCEALPELAPTRLCLHEWAEYIVTGASSVGIAGGKADQLAAGVFRFRFENQIGRAQLHFALPDGSHVDLPVEVLSNKYPTPEKHLGFFRALLEDLSRRAAQLPFTFVAPTAAMVDESPAPPTPLFTYHFFLQHAGALQVALDMILAAPNRRLCDESRWVSVSEACEVDDEVLLQMVTHPEHLVKVAVPATSACAVALKDHLPARVWQRLPRDTFDTPENRFVRAFAGILLNAAQAIREQSWWGHVSETNAKLIEGLIGGLSETLAASMFDEVGDMGHFPGSSQVLLRQDGYRELLALWRLFQLARRPFFAELQAAIDLRDVATLYEFWCFFRLRDKFTDAFGCSPRAQINISDARGLEYRARFEWPGLGRLIFNRSFSGGGGADHSYSVALRPDFVFESVAGQPAGVQDRIIFDAKFRTEVDSWWKDDEDHPSRSTKRADLYKMHTYRDALHAHCAIVLFPGDAPVFFGVGRGQVMPPPALVDLLKLEGVGALCMEPRKES